MLGLLTAVYFLSFTAAALPLRPLLDRFGPRRVQFIVLVVGAAGAALFAIGHSVTTLVVARALIGIGTSGALMAGLKALSLWVPKQWRTLANGGFIMFGGLSAMASTVPVDLMLPVFGWRGVFLILSGATLATALPILVMVPRKQPDAAAENWRANLRGLVGIYRDPAFWRLAPLSACTIGAAFAVHGLWAGRWLADVDLFTPQQVSATLIAMGVGLTVGAGGIGLIADCLRRSGIASDAIFGLACILFIGLQFVLLQHVAISAWLRLGAVGSFSAMNVLNYSIIGKMFPPEKIGRANSALNVLHLAMAFILQYGTCLLLSLWPADVSGHVPAGTYQVAFKALLVPQLAALIWFIASSMLHWRNDAVRICKP